MSDPAAATDTDTDTASEWEAFAELWDEWVDRSAAASRDKAFYLKELLAAKGPVVDAGIGTGRIALEAARRGKAIVGVDFSARMIARCRARAAEGGFADRVTLIQADVREMTLPEPAELIILPHRTIGMLVSTKDKLAALKRMAGQLAPGGRLIFDHWILDPSLDATWAGVQRLRAEIRDPASGREVILWEAFTPDFRTGTARIVATLDEIDRTGLVVARRYRRLTSSSFAPEDMERWAAEAGLEVAELYGDWDRSPLTQDCRDQIWVLRRPI